jgi:DNA-binding NarL/FixJ family response regulator
MEIKKLLLDKGGGGVGGGFVKLEDSNDEEPVFLAPDERRILELLCEGRTNKDIAKQSYLSTRRIEQLLTGLFQKTKVKNRTELVRWAIATGKVSL